MDFDYVTEPDDNLSCPICRNAFILPTMSTSCQHVFCETCILRAIELSPTCPIDRSELTPTTLIIAPRIIQQIVNELKVYCSSKESGCNWIGERERLSDHLKLDCARNLKGKAVERDLAEDSDPEVCPLCQAKIETQELHDQSCPVLPTTCTYCYTALLHRSEIPSHLLSCPLVQIPCPHSIHGCQALLPRNQMIEEHLELTCPYEPLKDFLSRYEFRMNEVESENLELRNRVGGLESGMTEMREVLDSIKSDLGAFYTPPLTRLPSAPNSTFPEGFIPLTESPSSPSPLTNTIESLSLSMQSLNSSFLLIENRQNEDFQLSDETLAKFSEEINSLRGGLFGMRMSMHHLLMEFNRFSSPNGFTGRGRMGMGMTGGMNRSEEGGGNSSSGSISDDETAPRFLGNGFSSSFPSNYGSSGSSSSGRNGMVGIGVRRYSTKL